ncbi:MAG: hypothetical protein ACTSXD_08445 [Candidatus Heimdallarchaeaceae archaeon]
MIITYEFKKYKDEYEKLRNKYAIYECKTIKHKGFSKPEISRIQLGVINSITGEIDSLFNLSKNEENTIRKAFLEWSEMTKLKH